MKRRNLIIILIGMILVGGIVIFVLGRLTSPQAPSTNISGNIVGAQCGAEGGLCTTTGVCGTSIGQIDCPSATPVCCTAPGGDGKKTLVGDCAGVCLDTDGCTCSTSCLNAGSINNGSNCGGSNPSCTFAGGVCLSSSSCPSGRTSVSGICSGSGLCCSGSTPLDGTEPTLTSCSEVCSNANGCLCPSGCNSTQVQNGAQCTEDSTVNPGTPPPSTNPTPPPPSGSTKAACGSTCQTTADCATPTNGGTSICRNNVCENAACAQGKTVPGANCDCSSLNACGNPCSASLGLCQAGSTCMYVNGPSCSLTDSNLAVTYCVPSTLPTGWTDPKCVSRDQGNNYVQYLGANPTQAQITAACHPVVTPATINCYRCTSALSDSDACELFTANGTTCPAGSSAESASCATAAGGSCPTQSTTNITCYRCSDALNDGDSCESFTATGSSCPSGSSSTSTACAGATAGGSCPIEAAGTLPNTGILDNNGVDILLGFLFIVLGITVYKYWKISGE